MLPLVVLVVCVVGALGDECSQCDYSLYDAEFEVTRKGTETNLNVTSIENSLIIAQVLASELKLRDEANQHVYPPNEAGAILFSGPLSPDMVTSRDVSNIMTKSLQVLRRHNCPKRNTTLKDFLEMIENGKYQVQGLCKIPDISCKDPSQIKYRTADGACNNLKQPTWGQSERIYWRNGKPNYDDGFKHVRLAKSGRELPSPRGLSAGLYPNDHLKHPTLNVAASIWAQLITHDLSLQVTDFDQPIDCCGPEGSFILPQDRRHQSCLPIAVPKDDYFYKKSGRRCMNFVRSIGVPRADCYLGPTEQMNGVASYLDVSFIYGSTKTVADSLRTFTDGLLIVSKYGNRDFLAPDANKSACDIRKPSDPCFRAGDVRVNQHLILAAGHIIIFREHNRCAKILKSLNPHWEDEKLYQEAKRITVAEYQHITYQEYLPYFLGQDFVDSLFKTSNADGYTSTYNENVNAAMDNTFSIAMRIYHSTIPPYVVMLSEKRIPVKIIKFSDQLNRVNALTDTKTGLDDALRGSITQEMYQFDERITTEITNLLFKGKNPEGLDLAAIDIQRGRDHGVHTYNDAIVASGSPRLKNFEELAKQIGKKKADKLKNFYGDVDDIDLMVGLLHEPKVDGTEFGKTANYFFREQFTRSMKGDRLFYTNPNIFTPAQLKEIKKATWARLICENSDYVQFIQREAFKQPSARNRLVSCKDIPKLNLAAWKQ